MIRDGTLDDIDQCLVMAEKFWKVAGYSESIEYDYDSTRDFFDMCLNCGLFSVAENNELVGFAAGIATRSMVNRNAIVGGELAWWMEPEHRHGPDSIRLLKHIENQAKNAGCKQWSMMCLESLDPEKVEQIYLRLGYKKAERTYVKNF